MDATLTDEKPQIAPQAAPQTAPPDDVRTQLAAIQHDLQELKAATQTILARLPAPAQPPDDAEDEVSKERRAILEWLHRPPTAEEIAARQEAMAQLRRTLSEPLSNGMTNDEFAALYIEICEAERER